MLFSPPVQRVSLQLHRPRLLNLIFKHVKGCTNSITPFSTSSSPHSNSNEEKNSEVIINPVVIYRWSIIKHLRLVSRFKIYQVTLMLAALPPLVRWYYLGSISTYSLGCSFVASLGTAGVLVFLSHYFRRVVGEMKFDPSTQTLDVSTLTFWGRRRERYIPLDKIVSFEESQSRMGGAIQRLKVEDSKEDLLWSLRYGRVMDLDLLCKALQISKEDLSHFY